MSGYAALEAFIAGVEQLQELNERVARAAEKPVADVVRANIIAGRSPSGEAWPEREEGGRALRGAAEALESTSAGTKIVLRIGPPYVFHNWGAGGSSTTKKAEQTRKSAARKAASSGTKSKFHAPRRQILPIAGEPIPEKMNEAIAETAKLVFEKAMGR